jgi:hypothetical protein
VPLEDADAYLLLAAASRIQDQSPALEKFLATVAEVAVVSSL